MTDQDIAPTPAASVDGPDEDLAAAVTRVATSALQACGERAGSVLVSPPDPRYGWGVSLEPRRSDAARVHVDAVDGELVLTVGRAWSVLDPRDPEALLGHLGRVLTGVLTDGAEEAVTGSPQARVRTCDGVVRLGGGGLPWRLRRRRRWAPYAAV